MWAARYVPYCDNETSQVGASSRAYQRNLQERCVGLSYRSTRLPWTMTVLGVGEQGPGQCMHLTAAITLPPAALNMRPHVRVNTANAKCCVTDALGEKAG